MGPRGVDVILDYLWGAPTEATIAAVSGRGFASEVKRVRLVQVGRSAGTTLTLPANALPSSGLELLGSGGGSVPFHRIAEVIPRLMASLVSGELSLDVERVPLSEVEAAWDRPQGAARRVFVP